MRARRIGQVLTYGFAAFAGMSLCAHNARAGWEILPESRHQLFQSYCFYVEQTNMIAWRGSNRYWASVATTIPVAGNNDSPWHPQVLFHLSGNDAMHVNDGGGVFTETLDTRIGILVEFDTPLWDLRASLGYLHESGHTVDGSDDPILAPLNLGDNVFRFRVMRDFDKRFRVGITIVPVSHAIPDNLVSGMDEFVEIFPWGSREDTHSASPYISGGLGNRLDLFAGSGYVYNAQIGVLWGNHFGEKHSHDLRFAIGYYSGSDPRAKYAQFFGSHSQFGYLGAMFDL